MGQSAPKASGEQRALFSAQAEAMRRMMDLTEDYYAAQSPRDEILFREALEDRNFNQEASRLGLDWAKQDRQKYDDFYALSQAYDPENAARLNAANWRTDADTTANAMISNATEQMNRGLTRRGIAPNSGAFAALNNQTALEGAKIRAGAVNNAIRAGDLAIEAAKAEKLNVMGVASGRANAGGMLGLSSNLGAAGLASLGTGINQFGRSFGAVNQGYGTAGQLGAYANQTADSIAQQDYRASQTGAGAMLGNILSQGAGIASGIWLGKM